MDLKGRFSSLLNMYSNTDVSQGFNKGWQTTVPQRKQERLHCNVYCKNKQNIGN